MELVETATDCITQLVKSCSDHHYHDNDGVTHAEDSAGVTMESTTLQISKGPRSNAQGPIKSGGDSSYPVAVEIPEGKALELQVSLVSSSSESHTPLTFEPIPMMKRGQTTSPTPLSVGHAAILTLEDLGIGGASLGSARGLVDGEAEERGLVLIRGGMASDRRDDGDESVAGATVDPLPLTDRQPLGQRGVVVMLDTAPLGQVEVRLCAEEFGSKEEGVDEQRGSTPEELDQSEETEEEISGPSKHQPRHARLRRSESLSEKQAKEARSRCKRIALLLSAAVLHPTNRGLQLYRRHRRRARRYTLVSYGTATETPPNSSDSSEDEEKDEDANTLSDEDDKTDEERITYTETHTHLYDDTYTHLDKDKDKAKQVTHAYTYLDTHVGLQRSEVREFKDVTKTHVVRFDLSSTHFQGDENDTHRDPNCDEHVHQDRVNTHKHMRSINLQIGEEQSGTVTADLGRFEALASPSSVKNMAKASKADSTQEVYVPLNKVCVSAEKTVFPQATITMSELKGKGALMFAQCRQRVDDVMAEHEQLRQKGLPVESKADTECNLQTHQHHETDDGQNYLDLHDERSQKPPFLSHHELGYNNQKQFYHQNHQEVQRQAHSQLNKANHKQKQQQSSNTYVTPQPIDCQEMGGSEQIALQDEHSSVPIIKTGLLQDGRRRGRPMFTFHEKPRLEPSPELLNLLQRDYDNQRRSNATRDSALQECPATEEDYLSLGAEACNILSSMPPQPLKPKAPPPLSPKTCIHPSGTDPQQKPMAILDSQHPKIVALQSRQTVGSSVPSVSSVEATSWTDQPTTSLTKHSRNQPQPTPPWTSTLPQHQPLHPWMAKPPQPYSPHTQQEQCPASSHQGLSWQQPPITKPQPPWVSTATSITLGQTPQQQRAPTPPAGGRWTQTIPTHANQALDQIPKRTSSLSPPPLWSRPSLSPSAITRISRSGSASPTTRPFSPLSSPTSFSAPFRAWSPSRLDGNRGNSKPPSPWEAAARHPLGLVDAAFEDEVMVATSDNVTIQRARSLAVTLRDAAARKRLPVPPPDWTARVSLDPPPGETNLVRATTTSSVKPHCQTLSSSSKNIPLHKSPFSQGHAPTHSHKNICYRFNYS